MLASTVKVGLPVLPVLQPWPLLPTCSGPAHPVHLDASCNLWRLASTVTAARTGSPRWWPRAATEASNQKRARPRPYHYISLPTWHCRAARIIDEQHRHSAPADPHPPGVAITTMRRRNAASASGCSSPAVPHQQQRLHLPLRGAQTHNACPHTWRTPNSSICRRGPNQHMTRAPAAAAAAASPPICSSEATQPRARPPCSAADAAAPSVPAAPAAGAWNSSRACTREAIRLSTSRCRTASCAARSYGRPAEGRGPRRDRGVGVGWDAGRPEGRRTLKPVQTSRMGWGRVGHCGKAQVRHGKPRPTLPKLHLKRLWQADSGLAGADECAPAFRPLCCCCCTTPPRPHTCCCSTSTCCAACSCCPKASSSCSPASPPPVAAGAAAEPPACCCWPKAARKAP